MVSSMSGVRQCSGFPPRAECIKPLSCYRTAPSLRHHVIMDIVRLRVIRISILV